MLALVHKKVYSTEVHLSQLEPGTRVVRLSGEIDNQSYPETRDLIVANLEEAPELAVLLDVSELTYMDSSGIKLFKQLYDMRKNRLAVCGISDDLFRLLTLAGLDRVLQFIKEPRGISEWGSVTRNAA